MQDYLMIAFKLLGALGLLIYGMRMMSDALQKMAGPQLRHILERMTTNRFAGMLTGAFVTCAVQSSSATTVMTVSFVSAGLLTLAQAISIIMGANIGTTLTAWIMSLGYSVDLTTVVFPAFFIGMILIYRKSHRYVGDFLFGIAFMFLSLVMLSSGGKELDLEHNKDVVDFFASFDTGTAQILEIPVFVNDTLLAAKTSPLSFRVDSLPVFVDTSAAFKDIVLPMDGKDVEIIKPENSGRNWLRIILLIVAILALIALAIFLLRKYLLPYLRKRKLEQMKALLKQNAGTVALNSLKGLKSKKLWQKGQVKDYYSELSMILRTYLDQQWDVNAKEMVTDEIMEAIDKLDLDDDLTKELYRFFVLSDLVKYAKEQPEVEAH